MTDDDDYLWDKSGEPDPDVVRLEETLGALRFRGELADLPEQRPGASGSSGSAWRVLFVAAASFLAAAAATYLVSPGSLGVTRGGPAWDVTRLSGEPVVGESTFKTQTRLHVGDWLETNETSSARIAVADIGKVEVGPRSRVRLVASRADEHRLELAEGELQALIDAPPRLFFVNTPSADAVDLGCQYTLRVKPNGEGILYVTLGFVAFERDGRESIVPAGAQCETRVGVGPGTPFNEDASEALINSLIALDFENGGNTALWRVLAEARPEDGISLWHLISRTPMPQRQKVYDRLAALVLPPGGVTRDGVLALDRGMLETWRKHLGLGW